MSNPSSFTPRQLADFAALIAAAMAQQPQPPAANPMPRVASIKDLGIALPTPFDGEVKKYLQFRRECLAYITADDANTVFTTDAKKISFVLSYMKLGTAATWAQNYYDAIMDATGAITFKDSTAEFLKKLDLSFEDAGQKERAYAEWTELRQGKSDASVFFANFEIKMSQAGIPTSDVNVVLPQVKRAIHPDVQAAVIRNPTKPKTYDELKAFVIAADANERELAELRRRNRPAFIPPPRRLPPAPQQPTTFNPNRGDRRNHNGILFGGHGEPMDSSLNRLKTE